MQQDNIYEIKEKKKDDLKIQNLITSNKVEFQIIQKSINLMQRYKKNKIKNPPKNLRDMRYG